MARPGPAYKKNVPVVSGHGSATPSLHCIHPLFGSTGSLPALCHMIIILMMMMMMDDDADADDDDGDDDGDDDDDADADADDDDVT